MSQLKAYHRPKSVDEALKLLSRSEVNTGVLGGGTYAVPHLSDRVTEVIDLQDVGLTDISHTASRLTLGAMTRLQTLVDDERIPALVREVARREGPNTLRHAATIGGVVVAGSPESELLAALLVFEAEVTVQTRGGRKTIALEDFLPDIPLVLQSGLVTTISLATTGQAAIDRVARTPADAPIVAAVARLAVEGQLLLALCGVAHQPVLVDPANVAAALKPPADFRGSSAYRRQMAVTLAQRVINEVSPKTG